MVLGYLNHIVQAVGKLIGSWNSQDSTITDMCFFLVEETVNKSDLQRSRKIGEQTTLKWFSSESDTLMVATRFINHLIEWDTHN